MNPLAIFSGPISGGLSPTGSARSGDASAGLELAFAYNSPFQVGGSGSQDMDAGQTTARDAGAGLPQNPAVLVGGVLVIAALIYALRQ